MLFCWFPVGFAKKSLDTELSSNKMNHIEFILLAQLVLLPSGYNSLHFIVFEVNPDLALNKIARVGSAAAKKKKKRESDPQPQKTFF